MKISIRSTTGIGHIQQLDVEPAMKIRLLKEQLSISNGGEYIWNMVMIFDNEPLDDDDILSDFDIQAGAVLELRDPDVTQRSLRGGFGLKFVDVSMNQNLTRIQWSTTASKWRRARHGLCFEGLCMKVGCDAYNKKVIVSVGYRKFDVSIDVNANTTRCPLCKTFVDPGTCAFNNCWWRFEGLKGSKSGPPESCSSDWKHADDAYHRFDEKEGNITSWRQLVLYAVRQKPQDLPTAAPEEPVQVDMAENMAEESEEAVRAHASLVGKLCNLLLRLLSPAYLPMASFVSVRFCSHMRGADQRIRHQEV